MTQEIIVYIIGALAGIYIIFSVWRTLTRRKNPCEGCAGCDLRQQLENKSTGCRTEGGDFRPRKRCGCGKKAGQ